MSNVVPLHGPLTNVRSILEHTIEQLDSSDVGVIVYVFKADPQRPYSAISASTWQLAIAGADLTYQAGQRLSNDD
jgi:hypothetical protein